MSKFTTPLLLTFGIAAALGIGGWRSATSKLSGANDSLTTTSNKLAEVTMKLAEQGSTVETLRVQLGLQKTDLNTASNQIAAASVQLAQQLNRIRAVESEVGERGSRITTLSRSNAALLSTVASVEAQVQSLGNALAEARGQVAEAGKKIESTASALNAAESDKSSLLAKLSDPSALRAQLDNVSASPNGKVRNLRDAKITIKPDGTVEVPVSTKGSPASERTTASVFSEPPVANTNAPRIILNY